MSERSRDPPVAESGKSDKLKRKKIMKAKSSIYQCFVPSLIGIISVIASHAQAVTLDECIGAALRNNPDVRAATERVQAASFAVREARSAYYPILGGSATYARTDNPPQAFMMLLNQRAVSMQADFNNPPETDNIALSLGIKYRLYDSGRRGLNYDMAKGGATVSRYFLKGLQNDLIYQITRGYYSVLQAKAFVDVQEESVRTIEESLRVANERSKAGEVVRTDVMNLEVQLAQAREDLIRSRNGVKLALAALNTAIGTTIVFKTNLAMNVDHAEIKKPESPRECESIQDRPELLAARWLAGIESMKVQKAQREYGPTVNLFGSSDWNRDWSPPFEQSYMVGVMAEMDIFDGFRRSSAVAGAKSQARAAEAEVEKTANMLQLDMTSAGLQLEESWERLDVARKIIENAQEALRITQERYRQGAATVTELLTAQVGLTGSRTRHVAALYDYLIAQSNVERAKGQLVNDYVK